MQSKSKIVYTKYEKARVIGARALQISMGAPILISISDDELKRINYSPVEIAKKELDEGILPITIKRPLPHKSHDEQVKAGLNKEEASKAIPQEVEQKI